MQKLRPWQWAVIHLLLFVLSLCTTIMAGTELYTGKSWWGELSWDQWELGIPYAVAFLTFLTFHEFGHYFAARYHQVRTTLPFYLPFYIPGLVNIGSLGAVIGLREVPRTSKQYFDIGIAGPLAGMVAAIGILLLGIWTLPDPSVFLLEIFPEWKEAFGGLPTEETLNQYLEQAEDTKIATGHSLFLLAILNWGVSPDLLPPAYGLIHYPLLFAGFLTLFATALNLLPIGQLDGGHITYAMFGRKAASIISRITVLGLLLVGGTGMAELSMNSWVGWIELLAYLVFLFYVMQKVLDQLSLPYVAGATLLLFCLQLFLHTLFPSVETQLIWLLYTLLVVRVVKLDHPPAYERVALNPLRMLLGWLALLIFFLCFTPFPLRLIGFTELEMVW